MSFRSQLRYMNPYDLHKTLVNEYILKRPGDTKLLRRDTARDRTDLDVIRENHKFLWDDTTTPDTWEEQFAKKYHDKLFKEYCIGDLSRYKENKIALRWRVEQEVVIGKGQFTCGNKICTSNEALRTWEVNFAYKEDGEKKNALVKIRLCPECSQKLNYVSKKREVKKMKQKGPRRLSTLGLRKRDEDGKEKNEEPKAPESTPSNSTLCTSSEPKEESPWENIKVEESKSRDEEMEEYLQELLL
uniref:Protein FRA10AC1 homolog n=1 Tax=Photinus pyralis TaxID=7054 RepID=A0A1Y1KC86_PHOPY